MIEQIRHLYWQKPFKPFTIHLADGRSLSVTHPEFMAFSPIGQGISVFQADGAAHYVYLTLVTDVVETPQAAQIKS
jgi:hypothetical protein